MFREMLADASLPDRAHLLLVSSPHTLTWLSDVPSPGLNFKRRYNGGLVLGLLKAQAVPMALPIHL